MSNKIFDLENVGNYANIENFTFLSSNNVIFMNVFWFFASNLKIKILNYNKNQYDEWNQRGHC